MPSNSTSAAGASAAPTLPKVEQVLHVRAKSILSCTFARSAASNRTGVAPPPSYQSVTVDGLTTLLHLNSRDGTVRTVGTIRWDPPTADDEGKKAPKRGAHVSMGEHTSEFADVLRKNKGVGKDLLLKSDVRALHLPGPGSTAPLHFQRVAMPSGGFPYTVYTIADMSLPPGPTHAHICVGQLTIRHDSSKSRPSSGSASVPALLPFFTAGRAHPKPASPSKTSGVVVRLELRTRDKEVIDKLVFSSLLVVAGKHPVEADARVELDRPVANEWDAPPALSTLATPQLSPHGSNEDLPSTAVPPEYSGDHSSERHLLAPSAQDLVSSDSFGMAGPGPSTLGMHMGAHSSGGSSILSAA